MGLKGKTPAALAAWVDAQRAARARPVEPAGAEPPAASPPDGWTALPERPGSPAAPAAEAPPAPLRPVGLPAETPLLTQGSSAAERDIHNVEAAGSTPAPATKAPGEAPAPVTSDKGQVGSGEPGLPSAAPAIQPPTAQALPAEIAGPGVVAPGVSGNEQPAEAPGKVNRRERTVAQPFATAAEATDHIAKLGLNQGRIVPVGDGTFQVKFTPKGKSFKMGPRADGIPDIIDAIQDLGGVPAREGRTGGEWDGHDETFKGSLRVLLRKQSAGIDQWLAELGDVYPEYRQLAADPSAFREAVGRAAAMRDQVKAVAAADVQTGKFMEAALEGKGRSMREPGPGSPVPVDELTVGTKFEVKREKFEVTDINPDTGAVVVKDGPRFGTQELPAGALLHADTNTLKAAETSTDFMPEGWSDAPDAPAAADPFSLESASTEQQGLEAQTARERQAKLDAQAKLASLTDRPLTGDSSNVGQGQLYTEHEDLFSGKSAEQMATEKPEVPELQVQQELTPQNAVNHKLKPNHIYVWGNDWGAARSHDRDNMAAVEAFPYQGDPVDAVRNADMGQMAPHVIMATDANGKPSKVISPNLNHVADFGTPEADYIAGDVHAPARALAQRITAAVESNDHATATSLLAGKVNELTAKIEATKGYIQQENKENERDLAALKAGKTVHDLDSRYLATKADRENYFEQRRRRIESFHLRIVELTADIQKWESLVPKSAEAAPAIEPVPANRQPESEVAAALAPVVRDLQGKPVGWRIAMRDNGATLISPDGKQMVKFWAADERSGSEALRQKVLAQAWAIDNPLQTPAEAAAPEEVPTKFNAGQRVIGKGNGDFERPGIVTANGPTENGVRSYFVKTDSVGGETLYKEHELTNEVPAAPSLRDRETQIRQMTSDMALMNLGQSHERSPGLVADMQKLGELLLPGVRTREGETLAQMHLMKFRGEVTEVEYQRYKNDLIKGGYVKTPEEPAEPAIPAGKSSQLYLYSNLKGKLAWANTAEAARILAGQPGNFEKFIRVAHTGVPAPADYAKGSSELAFSPVGRNPAGTSGAEGSPTPSADVPPETPAAPADDPNFTHLPIQLPEMLKFYRAISGGQIPRIVEKIRLLHGTAAGVFRHIDGPAGVGKIELRADLFNLVSLAEKQKLLADAVAWAHAMKQAEPDLDMREAVRGRFAELLKAAEAEALRKDPVNALKVFAHEIGHYIGWLDTKTLKRGNILGHIAQLNNYLKGFIGEHPALQDVEPPTANERAKLRRQAQKEIERGMAEIVQQIRREVPVYREIPITADHILSILKTAQREEFPGLYDWFSGLDRPNKAAVLRAAMKGIVDERAARLAARVQTGTKIVEETVTRRVGPEPTPEAIRARYDELLREELKRRGLISERDMKAELHATIAWWRGTEKIPDYFKTAVEMYAETFSILLNNPAGLAQRAPTFMRAFFNYLERKPETQAAYEKVQESIRSGVIHKERVLDLREMFRADEEAGLSNELAKQKVNWRTVRDTLRLLFDRQHGPMESRALAKVTLKHGKYGAAIGPAEAQRVLAATKDYLYRQTAVESYARQLLLQVEQPLAAANLRHDDLAEYMFHQRIAYGDRKNLANAQGWSPKLSLERLDEMAATYTPQQMATLKQVIEAQRQLYEQSVVRLLKQAEVLRPELMKVIEDNVLYSPFNKARDAFDPAGAETIEGLLKHAYGTEVTARIYRQIGYLGEIRSPYVALTQKAFSLIQFAYSQMAVKSLVSYLQEHEPSQIVPAEEQFTGRTWRPRVVETPQIGTLLVLEAGELKGYYVPRVISETMERGSPLEGMIVGGAHKVLAWPKALLTELNPGFWPVAFAKDMATLALQIPGGIKALGQLPAAHKAARATFSGAKNTLADAALNRLWVISRSDPRGEHLGHADETTRLLLRMGQSPALWESEQAKISKLLAMWMAWKRQGQILERTVKIAAGAHLDSPEFAGMPEWMKQRLIHEFAGSPDFLERGRAASVVEATGGPIFYNAWLQGMRAFKRSAQYDPKGFWTKFLAMFGLPAIAFYAFEKGWFNAGMNKEDAEDERDKLASIPERDKLRGFVLPLAWADKEQKKVLYLMLPFPDQVRFLHAGLRKILQTGAGDSARGQGVGTFVNYQGQDLPGQNPIIAEGIKWWQFAALGQNPYDNFRGRPTLDADVFASGQGAGELAKSSAANVTGGIVYRYRPEIPGETHTPIEKFLQTPGVGNMLGRWLRVSNAGVHEANQRATAEVIKHEAGLRIVADEMMRKALAREDWSKAEIQLSENEPYLAQHIAGTIKDRFMQATGPELRDYMRASHSERIALLNAWAARDEARAHRLAPAKQAP